MDDPIEKTLVSISTHLAAPFPFFLTRPETQHTISVEQKKVWKIQKSVVLSYPPLGDLLTGSDREPPCGLQSPEPSMSSDDCTISVAIWRMWER